MNPEIAPETTLLAVPPLPPAGSADLEPKEAPALEEAGAESAVPATYDAIVIGSGMGGLTAAALLARQQGWRVLILEQHFTVGGLTHEFRRGKFDFDVGLHYLGQMQPGGQGRVVFDYLTDGKLQWQQMTGEFERFHYPGLDFSVPSDPREYRRRLVERFPAEARAIARYFRDVKRAAMGYILAHATDTLPRWMRGGFRLFTAPRTRLAGMTTQAYLEQHFRDATLRALLASQWGDYGLPPAESLFGIHAVIVNYYLWGGWYPVGGAKSIASTMLPAILAHGGKAVAGRTVTQILMDDGRAVGVRVKRTYRPDLPEETYRAPVVISDAGVLNTYLRLLPADAPVPFRAALEAADPGYSAATLFLGLKESPAKLGIQGENHWIFDSFDHGHSGDLRALGSQIYLSFPSMKDPQARSHTAQIVTFLPYDQFSRWAGQPWKKREAAYYRLKAEIGGTLLQKVERHVPGLSALVEFQELSTPVTMEHFQRGPRGTFYGMPARPGRLFAPWTHTQSPIPGLYLTGQDVMSLGVAGAMMGGVKCAGALSGPFGFFRIMGRIFRTAAQARPSRSAV